MVRDGEPGEQGQTPEGLPKERDHCPVDKPKLLLSKGRREHPELVDLTFPADVSPSLAHGKGVMSLFR